MARTRPGLTRDAVLAAALAIIDDGGLDACTMRAVASALGVEAMSLYWHVENKDALLDGVVELILMEVVSEREELTDWRDRLGTFAYVFRNVLLRHRNAVPLLANRRLGAYTSAGRMTEAGIASLEAAGFDRRTAIRAARTVSRYVVGFTLAEAGPRRDPPPPDPDAPALGDLLEAVAREDPKELFAFGLETLLDGLEARLTAV